MAGRGMPFIIGPREMHRRAGFPKSATGGKPVYLHGQGKTLRPLAKHPAPRKGHKRGQ